jgi:hypothetical protein
MDAAEQQGSANTPLPFSVGTLQDNRKGPIGIPDFATVIPRALVSPLQFRPPAAFCSPGLSLPVHAVRSA